MQASTQTLLGLVESAGSRDELSLVMNEVTRALGFQYFALTHHVDLPKAGGTAIRLHNYPDKWADHYDRQSLSLSDPVHRASQVTGFGFQWSSMPRLIPLGRGDQAILEEGRRQGIGDGYTVPVNIPGEACGSCTFVNPRGEAMPLEFLPPAQVLGAKAFEVARGIWFPQMSLERRQRHILTERQRDCVLWVARGKSDWEISRILGISEETVAQHIRMACDRYGVNKRVALAFCAVADRTITIHDVGPWVYNSFPG
ncbi:MAG: LuxR family transcriptional regulator [Novosphingobium sp. 17-62-19]|uniref:helix-turn-helix transcriptional regulator n=1 Tax=Novosphingobium sp. 17-62-19 TaxID=1970406 RepID=UPI000BCE5512|nr:autoinducer binding domain-containing protein [Novosphingobium sp. 17-62-19]OYX94942.1 MAG: LuxR family transcriptional regulator [Novosphingobium sp. 35-62-5]OZA18154.1 MAG: LuxR family transcriptional regulator [Novosphingobium sp. 17-62-19]